MQLRLKSKRHAQEAIPNSVYFKISHANIYANVLVNKIYNKKYDTVLSNLRAKLKSNKIFNIIINSFTLFNSKPEIQKKDKMLKKMNSEKVKI